MTQLVRRARQLDVFQPRLDRERRLRVGALDQLPGPGLDPIGMRDARDWIRAATERGCSVLISSHLLSEVEQLCNRVVILHEGVVRAEGAMHEVVREGEQLEDAFIRLVEGSGGGHDRD